MPLSLSLSISSHVISITPLSYSLTHSHTLLPLFLCQSLPIIATMTPNLNPSSQVVGAAAVAHEEASQLTECVRLLKEFDQLAEFEASLRAERVQGSRRRAAGRLR